jgi:hypothetical protein
MLSELLNADAVWDVRRVGVTIVVSGYEAENKDEQGVSGEWLRGRE